MHHRPIASLTRRGWIKDVVEKADFILAYFFETLPSQSWMFRQETVSVQDIYSKFTNDPEGFSTRLQSVLTERFRIYFDNTQVRVQTTNPEEQKRTGKTNLVISITIFEKGKEYSLSRELQNRNNVFEMVVKQVNVGE